MINAYLGVPFQDLRKRPNHEGVKVPVEVVVSAYNTLRWADSFFYSRDGKGLTHTELSSSR